MTDQKPMMADVRKLLEWLDADSHLHSGEYDAIRRRQFRQAIEEAHANRPRIARERERELRERSSVDRLESRPFDSAVHEWMADGFESIADAYGEPE